MIRATAYVRNKKFILHASSRTTDSVWILTEPCIQLRSDCSDETLGDAVQAALRGSKDRISHPTQWKELAKPLLDAAGVTSWKTFAKSAKCVEIEQNGQALVLIPTANLGAAEGYRANEEKTTLSLPVSSNEIGSRLRQVFSQAK